MYFCCSLAEVIHINSSRPKLASRSSVVFSQTSIFSSSSSSSTPNTCPGNPSPTRNESQVPQEPISNIKTKHAKKPTEISSPTPYEQNSPTQP